ncbi:hypothetical protein PIB30_089741 [Stylosanthes scabra]|uniref:Uncharacterized protein n=1 Tax=Stylosanthes scabra TaxID=79078 RepID=A0ABU6UTI3_9FABA|nr:hypothetical protein [Stylosanthes scabra]
MHCAGFGAVCGAALLTVWLVGCAGSDAMLAAVRGSFISLFSRVRLLPESGVGLKKWRARGRENKVRDGKEEIQEGREGEEGTVAVTRLCRFLLTFHVLLRISILTSFSCVLLPFSPWFCQPLHLAARQKQPECLHALLDNGALVCASTDGYSYLGSMQLHMAAHGGSVDCFWMVLAWGADRLQLDSSRRIPFSVALKH